MSPLETREEQRRATAQGLGLESLQGQTRLFWLAAVGLLGMLICCLGPWSNPEDVNAVLFGFQSDDGKFFLLLTLAAGYSLWRTAAQPIGPAPLMALLIALIVLAGATVELLVVEGAFVPDDIAYFPEGDGPSQSAVQSSWGLWLLILGALAATAGSGLTALSRTTLDRAVAPPRDRHP